MCNSVVENKKEIYEANLFVRLEIVIIFYKFIISQSYIFPRKAFYWYIIK